MNIVLIGYGKMGKTIESIATERGHRITGRIDIGNKDEIYELKSFQPDVAIEFSHPEAAFENITRCLEQDIVTISGTTGWLSGKNEVDELCRKKNGTFFYASNFSLGVNIFFRLNEFLGRVMNQFPMYEVDITEIHHTEKKDAPSGTAITLAEGIIQQHSGKKKWINEPASDPSVIPIKSVREGKVPGTHEVNYRSESDIISLRHEALTRRGFAVGVILVAEWIRNRKGVLDMKDFLVI